jgi:acetyl esterase
MTSTFHSASTERSADPAPTDRAATKHRFLRRLLAATALGWAVVGLLLGLMIVLPTPNVGFPAVVVLDTLAMLVEEASLWLAAFTLLGVGLALLARRAGVLRTWIVAAALGVVTIGLSLVPVVQGWRTASQEGVALSLSDYFSLPSLGSPETVTYARPEGEQLKVDVRRPPDEGSTAGSDRRPAVVVVHGGGGIQGGRGDEAPWAEWLAEEGYVAFSIDYRLGFSSSLDATGDVKCAVGWVKENAARYGVDPGRIALMGHSDGGRLALLAAYTEGDPRLPPSCNVPDTGVEAAAAFYPLTDQTHLDKMKWPWWRPNLTNSVDDPTEGTPENALERRLASPASHADPGDPPTFLTHGRADQWMPSAQSELLANRLEDAGVPHRLIELRGARHGFDAVWGGWNSQIVRHELEDFLENRLGEQSADTR